MDDSAAKATLKRYLDVARDALVWKLEGLGEYDIRRPVTPTAGHADIIRELIDGSAGLRPDALNLPEGDSDWWSEYRARVQAAAEEAGR